jgi:hypothetical protein
MVQVWYDVIRQTWGVTWECGTNHSKLSTYYHSDLIIVVLRWRMFELTMCTVVMLAFLMSSLPSGRLSHLQGVCVPCVHFCGYWRYGMIFVLATSVIRGQHPHPGEPISASAGMAVKVGMQWLD